MSTSASIRGTATVSKPAATSSARPWLFRGLVLAGGAVMFVSWIMPWWRAYITQLDRWVAIRPWGLEHNLGDLAGYIKDAAMPTWFAPVMWAYLGISLAVLLFSLFAPERKVRLLKFEFSLPQLLIIGVGISYIVCVVVAFVYASMRMDSFWHLKMIGKTYVELGEIEKGYVDSNLLTGYWLAAVAGPVLLVLGLLRSKIVGTPKPSA
jgi:hypothetical protein